MMMVDPCELSALIENAKSSYASDPEKWSDEKALGVMLSMYLRWDGDAILRTFEAALTDANFHDEAAQLRRTFPEAFEEVVA